jgi:hypothetical protein
MAAHRRGDQVQPYSLIAERAPERELVPSLARLMAVSADMADPAKRPSDAELTGMLLGEEQAYLEIAAAPVRDLRDLRRKVGVVSLALLEEDADPKRTAILLAALSADVDHLMRLN